MTEKQMYPLEGIVVSLNTPFDEQDRVDFRSVGRLVERHLAAGAVGFLVPAQAGEVYELTLAERIDLIRCVRELTRGRAELIAGTTARDERESLQVAEAAIATGCQGVLVEVPESRKRDRRATNEFLASFSALQAPMLMIQDLDFNGFGLEVEVIAELFERIEQFRCLKVEVSPAGPKCSAVIEATAGRLHVSGGWASLQLIEALDRGVAAFMPTAMTGLFTQAMKAYRRGDRDEAKRWFHRMLPVLAFTRQHLDTSIHFHKRLFHQRGIFRTARVRKRTIAYDAWHERYGDELIAYLNGAEPEAMTRAE